MINISDIYKDGPHKRNEPEQQKTEKPPGVKPPEYKASTAEAESAYNRAILTSNRCVNRVRDTGRLDITDEDLSAISNLFFLVEKEKSNMELLFYENTPPDYIYAHLVNVCIMSLILAGQMVYNRDQLIMLAIASFFHDVGMSFFRDVYNKDAPLTGKERSLIEQHVVRGRDIMLSSDRFSAELRDQMAEIIYTHHERFNGSGYPNGISGNDINNFTKVIAVSDIYETLTHHRPWRPAVSGAKAMEILLGYRDNVSPDTVRIMLNELSVYPKGSVVRLNDGRRARVVEINKKALTCPKVEILDPGESGEVIDLAVQKLFAIEDVE